MEIANLWRDIAADTQEVRPARRSDAPAVTRLLQEAPYSHLHADWNYPIDWLGDPGFVLLPEKATPAGMAATGDPLFGARERIRACLAVAADPPPAAWVRVAALRDEKAAPAILSSLLAAVAPHLQQASVSVLGWLLVDDWPETWFQMAGFRNVNYIETLRKDDHSILTVQEIPDLHIRPVRDVDLETLAAIEALAYEPLWRHSRGGLERARRHTLSFSVAIWRDEIAGFQFSTRAHKGAHLSRMTVAPAFQGQGVGTSLLAHTLAGYYGAGLHSVSLNTQADNDVSKRLYHRFGFRPTGQSFPVWAVEL